MYKMPSSFLNSITVSTSILIWLAEDVESYQPPCPSMNFTVLTILIINIVLLMTKSERDSQVCGSE